MWLFFLTKIPCISTLSFWQCGEERIKQKHHPRHLKSSNHKSKSGSHSTHRNHYNVQTFPSLPTTCTYLYRHRDHVDRNKIRYVKKKWKQFKIHVAQKPCRVYAFSGTWRAPRHSQNLGGRRVFMRQDKNAAHAQWVWGASWQRRAYVRCKGT